MSTAVESLALTRDLGPGDRLFSMPEGDPKVPGNPGPTRSESGDFELTFWAVNVSEGPATRAFSAVVLKENGRPLSTLDCETGPAVPSGEIVLVDCVTTDDFETGWRGVGIQAAN